MLEREMKDDFFWYLDGRFEKLRVMEELVIGRSRADMAVVLPDMLVGFELKSNGDTYARLPIQIKYYDKFFDRNYLVVGETHRKNAHKYVPDHWGIICIPDVGNDITVLREAGANTRVKLRWQLSLLWRSELMNIQLRHGLNKYANKSKAYVIRYLMDSVGESVLKRQLCDELFEREYADY